MKDFNMEDLTNDDSSSDCQYVKDIDSLDNDDLDNDIIGNLMDVEEQKIDILTKNLYYFKERLSNFSNEPLENINELRRYFYLICEDNRYLIEDSFYIQNLEKNINESISYYEDKLFKAYDKLVEEEDYMNLKIESKNKIENERKLIHEWMIYGEKLQKEINNITENNDDKLSNSVNQYYEESNLSPDTDTNNFDADKNKLLAYRKAQKYNKYNAIYQISELDRLKEKYHILYDTEENIVEYIISAYR